MGSWMPRGAIDFWREEDVVDRRAPTILIKSFPILLSRHRHEDMGAR